MTDAEWQELADLISSNTSTDRTTDLTNQAVATVEAWFRPEFQLDHIWDALFCVSECGRLKIFQALHTVRPDSPEAYVRNSVKKSLLNIVRKEARDRAAVANYEEPASQLTDSDLELILAGLPEKQATAVKLKSQGYSSREIAEIEGVSDAAICYRLADAERNLSLAT